MPGGEISPLFVSSLISIISIVVVAIAFLIPKYNDVKDVPNDAIPYKYAICGFNYALLLAILSLVVYLLSQLKGYGNHGYTAAVVLFLISLLLIISTILYLSHKVLNGGLLLRS
jgi:hypothetical protein